MAGDLSPAADGKSEIRGSEIPLRPDAEDDRVVEREGLAHVRAGRAPFETETRVSVPSGPARLETHAFPRPLRERARV